MRKGRMSSFTPGTLRGLRRGHHPRRHRRHRGHESRPWSRKPTYPSVCVTTPEKVGATLRVNLVAPFELARECARAMMASGNGGTIVNVASIWGLVGVGQIPEAGYAASKGGLVNLTRELAAQWARKGVRVNCLAPGWFRSEMTEGVMFGDERSERWMRQRTPMGRGGEEHELDSALLLLASDASSFMTGQVVCVDGGWTSV